VDELVVAERTLRREGRPPRVSLDLDATVVDEPDRGALVTESIIATRCGPDAPHQLERWPVLRRVVEKRLRKRFSGQSEAVGSLHEAASPLAKELVDAAFCTF